MIINSPAKSERMVLKNRTEQKALLINTPAKSDRMALKNRTAQKALMIKSLAKSENGARKLDRREGNDYKQPGRIG